MNYYLRKIGNFFNFTGMRREIAEFLNTDLQYIRGVGPVMAERFNDVLGGRRVLDFLLHKPAYVRNREITESIANVDAGATITIPLMIKSHKSPGKTPPWLRRARATRVMCVDKLGYQVAIQFFNSKYTEYWLNKLPVGQWRMVSGKIEAGKIPVMNHPEFIEEMDAADKIPDAQAIYPAGMGLTQKQFMSMRDQIFAKLTAIISDEYDDAQLVEFFDALRHVHFAKSSDDLLPNSTYVAKLAYCELFAHQCAIAISRRNRITQRNKKQKRIKTRDYLTKFWNTLPYNLTNAQQRVVDEIFHDMASDTPMMRLVQGDVGSGKTIVAVISALRMAESGGQTALLAPTDTLAQQHFAKIRQMCENLGIVVDVLTGRDKGAARREKLISIRSGRTKIIIGTHALFSDDVEYKDLGLVIVDEQHRFGVNQREALRAKGANVDLLALSATPIPRTLSMTMYGDMDISIINEKPAGRLPIRTTKLPIFKTNELIERIKTQIATGAKVFWICPLVADENGVGVGAAIARHDMLKQIFPTAGLVHGQMPKDARDKIMAEFADDNSDMNLLVATTVIEVGIDVSRASIIVIENAEQFGLAALHQLRGRVGRGNIQSFCILLYGPNVSADGLKRLDVLCETDDGFVIAEQDLMMRGVGELLGTRQSGWIQYHFADWREHRDLFKLAARAACDNDVDTWARDLMGIFNCGEHISA
ncbi:MAG: ATP-dependent DNA helicase RecG [Alphaproteobacteria bacterium]|nr:ATP-dependent DNA helicase RecG [Alphaproteobacteria bacterium]